MKNTMEIDGYKAVIQFDPEIDMFRGEFIGLNGGADFYAPDIAGLRKEGAHFAQGVPRDVRGGRRRAPEVVLGEVPSAHVARTARERGCRSCRRGEEPQPVDRQYDRREPAVSGLLPPPSSVRASSRKLRGAVTQGHPVLALRLHARCRNGPHALSPIDLRPLAPPDLAPPYATVGSERPGGSQLWRAAKTSLTSIACSSRIV